MLLQNSQMVSPHSSERINQILFYIDNNLDQELSLEVIAGIGCYSEFHLHRLFKTVTGETLNNYIIRKRIEKIAYSLMFHKDISVTELAAIYGFNSISSLTRSFTKFYGVSPTQFRKLLPSKYSKIGITDSKIGQMPAIFEQYICNIDNYLNYLEMNAKIEIKELAGMNVARVTCIGVQGLDHAFGQIMKWARGLQLNQLPDFKLIRIFHDSFRITAPDKVRMSIGAPVPSGTITGGEVSLTTIEKGKHIVARFLIAPEDFGKSWESLFVWMNEQGYKKANRDPFEFLYNNYNDHPEGKCEVDLCIPIL